MDINIYKIYNKLKENLKKERYEHSISVSFMAMSLAMRYNCNLKDAQIAGLLHDIAKNIPIKKQIDLCNKYKIILTKDDLKTPFIIHSYLGAYIAKKEFNVNDNIYEAIKNHTLGKANMNILSKIIYVSDYIEPLRERRGNIDKIRYTSFIDINKSIYMITNNIKNFLKNSNKLIHPQMYETLNYYKQYKY